MRLRPAESGPAHPAPRDPQSDGPWEPRATMLPAFNVWPPKCPGSCCPEPCKHSSQPSCYSKGAIKAGVTCPVARFPSIRPSCTSDNQTPSTRDNTSTFPLLAAPEQTHGDFVVAFLHDLMSRIQTCDSEWTPNRQRSKPPASWRQRTSLT